MANCVEVTVLDDGIGHVMLNRPNALNAIDSCLVRDLRKAVSWLESSEDVSVIVLSGAGSRGFSAGVDLKERQHMSDSEASEFRSNELFPMYREFDTRQKPAVAAVHGYTLAGGLELALACDVIVAAEDSCFGLPEVKWGLVPAAGGCRKLASLIGPLRAKELILTAASVDAQEALALGMVNQVVANGRHVQEAIVVARKIAANRQNAVRGAKRCVDEYVQARAAAAFDLEVADACYASDDRVSGIAAFSGGRRAGDAG